MLMSILNAFFDNWPMIVIIAAVVVVVAILIISFSISVNNEKTHEERVSDLSTSTRVYVVDLKNDVVKFFNRSLLRQKRTSSLVDFYSQFKIDERAKLIKWVSDLIDPSLDTKPYFQVNVLESKHNKLRYSILQVLKIDYEAQVIHLESYILKLYNETIANRTLVGRYSKRKSYYSAVKKSTPKRGVTAVFNFFNRDKESEVEFPYIVISYIRNLLVNNINLSRRIFEYDNHKIIFADFSVQNKPQMLVLLTSLINEINRVLAIISYSEQIAYSVSAVEHKYFPLDPDAILNQAVEIAKYTEEEEIKDVTWYEPGRHFETTEDVEIYHTEVEKIIRDNGIKYLYRPIYDAERNKVFGYEMFVKPLDSFFASIEELKSYAIKTGDDRDLFSTITRKGITQYFADGTSNKPRLFYPISYKERPYVIRTLSHIQKNKEIHLVLVLSEAELSSISGLDEDELVNTLRSFKSKGYEVGLLFSSNDMPFSKKVYASFDFYLISIKDTLYDKSGNRTLTQLRGFAEKLIHYHKTIISTNIPTWDAVELMIRLGLSKVTSDTISAYDEMILPVGNRIAQKIKKIVDSQGDKYGK